ncbi:hypothetical protein L9G15_22610, partial [Shewanella sp. A3A]|nr:hypothetical protein [Shewanella ferrihydritica]
KAKKALDEATLEVNTVHARLVDALNLLSQLLVEEHIAIKVELTAYLENAEEWEGGAIPDAGALNSSLHNLTTALDASIEEIVAKQGEHTYFRA